MFWRFLKRAEFRVGLNSSGRIFEGVGLELFRKWWAGHGMAKMEEAKGKIDSKNKESCVAINISTVTMATTTGTSITSMSYNSHHGSRGWRLSQPWPHLALAEILQLQLYRYYSNLTSKNAETLRGKVTCLRSHKQSLLGLGSPN